MECGTCGDKGLATGEVVHAVGEEHGNAVCAGVRT